MKPALARPVAMACPECGKPALAAFKPFCSARCHHLDLHRWLSGSYAIPATEEPEPGDGDDGGDAATGGKHH